MDVLHCTAIQKNGTQCMRRRVCEEGLCSQHLQIYISLSAEIAARFPSRAAPSDRPPNERPTHPCTTCTGFRNEIAGLQEYIRSLEQTAISPPPDPNIPDGTSMEAILAGVSRIERALGVQSLESTSEVRGIQLEGAVLNRTRRKKIKKRLRGMKLRSEIIEAVEEAGYRVEGWDESREGHLTLHLEFHRECQVCFENPSSTTGRCRICRECNVCSRCDSCLAQCPFCRARYDI